MNEISGNKDFGDRRIFSVSDLTASIKTLVEEHFPFVWVSGEISNFRMPSSGHFYFTLKDNRSRIGAVMFRGQNRNLNFDLEDGIRVTGLGRISVYEPRGVYQLIFEYIEPKGVGALQLAFEKLKKSLAEEGLFDTRHKKQLPVLPRHISLITSPTGAVVHDIIQILFRRFPNMALEILPVKVQGDGASEQIAASLHLANQRGLSDLVIIARGGGSLEDLQAFNSEPVARAIFVSDIPVVSAVGHEVDFTIADFVADLRAPTPSAAAELVVPVKTDLEYNLKKINLQLFKLLKNILENCIRRVKDLDKRIVHPRKKIDDYRLKLDDMMFRIANATRRGLDRRREKLEWRSASLLLRNPAHRLDKGKDKLYQLSNKLSVLINISFDKKHSSYRKTTALLNSLGPMAVLKRGYSITRTTPDASVVRNADEVSIDQPLEILLSEGGLFCRVERKTENGKKIV